MPLAMVLDGETKTIEDFRGKDETRRHLQDMGIMKGAEVQVVGRNASGVILLVKGVRVALNRGLANQILVS